MTTESEPDPLSHRALGLPIYYVDHEGNIRKHRAVSREGRRRLHNVLHPESPVQAPPSPPSAQWDRSPLPIWALFLPALLIIALVFVFH